MVEFLYHNKGNGTFEEVGLPSEVAVDIDGRTYAGMGVDSPTTTMTAGRISWLLTWQINDTRCIETTVMAHSRMRARLLESAR